MSVPSNEPEGIVLGNDPAASMAELFNFLVAEPDEAPAGEGAAEAGAPAEDAGQQPAAGEGAGGAGAAAPAPAAGDGGQPPVPGDGAAAPGPAAGADGSAAQQSSAPAVGTFDSSDLDSKWGELSTSFETRQTEAFHAESLAAVREEYPRYFEALSQHPRLLIGQEVPKADGSEGFERLRDAADAQSWQEAIKHQLAAEVRSRTEARVEDMRGTFEVVHASIDLFRNNADLIPGSRQFDRELADQFATMAKDYELRSDGKLVGYSVPVQPLINQIRSQLAASRAKPAAPAAPAAPSPQQQRAAEQPRTPLGQFDGPQAGITSKAGSSAGSGDDIAQGVMDAFLRQNGITI